MVEHLLSYHSLSSLVPLKRYLHGAGVAVLLSAFQCSPGFVTLCHWVASFCPISAPLSLVALLDPPILSVLERSRVLPGPHTSKCKMFALFPFPTCPFNQAGKDSCRHIREARPLGGEFLFLCQRSGKLRCREFICPIAAMRCLWQSETGPESLVLIFSPQIILPSSGTVVSPITALSFSASPSKFPKTLQHEAEGS